MREGGGDEPVPPEFIFASVIILERKLAGVSAASLARFARRAQRLARCRGEINILVTGSRRLQELNRAFRNKNRPTDVLSFAREDEYGGDIAISLDLARSNARVYRHSTLDELRILILHGMLHLAGHDHESDRGEMARLEAGLRSKLKLPISLIERVSSNGVISKSSPRAKRSAARRGR